MDEFGVDEVFGFDFVVEWADGGSDEGVAEFFDDGAKDVVVGHADADCLIGVEVVARHFVVGVHDEGVGAGEATFEELEGVFVDGTEVLGCLAEGGAEHGVAGFFEGVVFELRDFFDRLFEFHAAGEGIEGVGGENGDGSLVEEVDDLSDVAGVGIIVVESCDHSSDFGSWKRVAVAPKSGAKVCIFFGLS